jgi:hypothetical protein
MPLDFRRAEIDTTGEFGRKSVEPNRELQPMSATRTAEETLGDCYLDVRARLIEIAACLDRIDRAAGAEGIADPRLVQIRQALEILKEGDFNRAERVQMIFSDAYKPGWDR